MKVRLFSCKAIFTVIGVLSIFLATSSVNAAIPIDTKALRDAVVTKNIKKHMEALQSIANVNGGTRATGPTGTGYDASIDYVKNKLEKTGYFNVYLHEFSYPKWVVNSTPILEMVSPLSKSYPTGAPFLESGFIPFTFSKKGTMTGNVVLAGGIIIPPTPSPSSMSGCSPADFPPGDLSKIVLVQRGTCTFDAKIANAEAAGYGAVIVFNEGQVGRTLSLFGEISSDPFRQILAIGASFDVGKEIYDLVKSGQTVTMHVTVDADAVPTATKNLIAETKTGRTDRIAMAGAHLDSVAEGPGINDNGSGSATILEVALQMAKLNIKPVNQVRFAWWAAEEDGIWGSYNYVVSLNKKQIQSIAMYLNFDMLASPNYKTEVYTSVGNPNGSKAATDVFRGYFDSQGIPYQLPPSEDNRSDHAAFSVFAGIPVGGLFSGAEELKTSGEFALYGGALGQPLDPCYHLACDTISNITNNSIKSLDIMSDAAAHAILTFGMTTSSVNGTDKGNAFGNKSNYLGPYLTK